MIVNIIVNYFRTRVLWHAKMLKETETKERVSIFVIGCISIGGPGPLQATHMICKQNNSVNKHFCYA